MNTNTLLLVRMIVRRDRVRIAVWILAIVVMVAISAGSVKGLFPTQADLDRAAAASDNPAIVAFNGPAIGLDTLGGEIAFQTGAPSLVIVALMALLMTGRLTRGEEEAGRLELVRSLPVGAYAPLLAALIVVSAMSAIVGALITLVLLAFALPVAGSVSFGLAFVALGMVFTAITAVTAQLTENHRLATGLAGCALGAAFLLRAIGDLGSGALSWASPIGWVQKARPFAGEAWWPFLVPALAFVVGLTVAARLSDRRDVGGGLFAPRPGPATAAPSLRSPFALAVRTQRGALLAWALGVGVMSAAYGALVDSIRQFVEDNPTMAELLTAGGGSLIDSYLAMSVRVAALLGSGFAVQSMLRLRGEESAGRAGPVLATPVSRRRWIGAHLAVAVGGSVIVQFVGGLAMGISAAAVAGDGALVGRTLGASLAYLPATWVLVGAALLLIGVRPEWNGAAWAVLGLAFVIAYLGPVLDLPSLVLDLSPFQHVALLPAAGLAWLPTIALLALALVLGAIGGIGVATRDLD